VLRIGRHLCTLLPLAFCCVAAATDATKILRVASPDIETLDPQQYADDPSFQVLMAIYEPLYEWDYLASPPKLTPLTAAGPIAITDDGRTWTVRLRTGIFFTDDPAFKSKSRELVAEDYVYSYKRWLDPNLRRGGAPIPTDLIIGARPVVDAARKSGKFDYDRPIEGLRALDRYTLQLRLNEPNYPIIRDIFGFVGAAAREVVEAAGGDIRTRAVGTGPFRLREWKRGSRLVLDANPAYRRVRFPANGDPAQAALVRSMQGKNLPQIAGVEVNIIEEDLPRVLQFEQGGLDYIVVRGEVANRLLADRALKPEYARRGITRRVYPEPFLFSFYFNVADPVLGGMTGERIALRRAIASALDVETLGRVVYAGHALPANQIVPPRCRRTRRNAAIEAAVRSGDLEGLAGSLRLYQGRRWPPQDAGRKALDADAYVALGSGVARNPDARQEGHGCGGYSHGFSADPVPGRDQGIGKGSVPDVLRWLWRFAIGLAGALPAL